jgi:hypothetical protein
MQRTLSLITVLTTAALASAQATHTQLFPATSPTARAGLHGVSDGAGMWVFGGLTAGSPLALSNEMWRFDGANWTNHTPAANNPPARDWYASAWDSARSRYVLFGGRVISGTGSADVGDTWEFDGTSWTQLSPALSPSPRRWSAMCYDPTLGKCVLFGGSLNGSTFYGDTWTWDGTNWAQLAPAASPSPRARGWLEWDLIRNRAIYTCGKNSTASTALAETWSWDSSTWTQVPTNTLPGWNGGTGLIAFGLTFDLLRDRYVLVGGTRTTATVSPQTYEHDGSDWILRPTGALTGRTGPAVAFVIGLGKTFVFGGSSGVNPLGDTWQYQTDDWAANAPFGTGCVGGGGVMTLAETHAAWIGETHATHITNLDPLGICVGIIGLTSVPAGVPLAAVLPTTSPSCMLYVSLDATPILGNLGGTADLLLPIPNDPTLVGLQVFEQAAQFNAAFVFSTSAATALTIGAK